MEVLIVYTHPEPSSFCAALKDEAVRTIREAGHGVTVSDLYGESFNPVAGRHDFVAMADPERFHYQSEQEHAARSAGFSSEITREQSRVEAADLVVFVFPLWWGGPPAILKGWIDRVLAYGFAYVDGARFETGLLRHKRGLLCVTTGGTPARFSPDGIYGEIEKVLWPIQHLTLAYMGLQPVEPFVCYGTPRVGPEGRAAYLESWRERLVEVLSRPLPEHSRPEVPAINHAAPWSRGS